MSVLHSAPRFTLIDGLKGTVSKALGDHLVEAHEEHGELLFTVHRASIEDALRILTIHSSKGLEYDTVYLLGMEEELLPHKKTIKQGEDIAEERRLCYVGLTRAKRKLIMTYCKERTIYNKKIKRFKSRFRITTNGGQCISCGNCSTYCEMGIDVRWYAQRGQNIVRSSCVGCGVCSAVCPRGVLKLENGPEEGRINELPIIIGNDSVKINA